MIYVMKWRKRRKGPTRGLAKHFLYEIRSGFDILHAALNSCFK